MASLRRSKSLTPDGQTARFLYTILKQLDLKTVDWTIVAEAIGITNGHAARMRYSRFKQQIEGLPNKAKKEKPKKSETRDKGSSSDAQGKRRRDDEHAWRNDGRDAKQMKVEPCFTQPWQFMPPSMAQRFHFEPAQPQFDMGAPSVPSTPSIVKPEPLNEQATIQEAPVGQAEQHKQRSTPSPATATITPQEPKVVKSEPEGPSATSEAIVDSLFVWPPESSDLPADLQLPSTPDLLSANLDGLLQPQTNNECTPASIAATQNPPTGEPRKSTVALADLQLPFNPNQSISFLPSPTPVPNYATGPAYGYSYGYRIPPGFPSYAPVRPGWHLGNQQPFSSSYPYNPYGFSPNTPMATPRTFAVTHPNLNFVAPAPMLTTPPPLPSHQPAAKETSGGSQE